MLRKQRVFTLPHIVSGAAARSGSLESGAKHAIYSVNGQPIASAPPSRKYIQNRESVRLCKQYESHPHVGQLMF